MIIITCDECGEIIDKVSSMKYYYESIRLSFPKSGHVFTYSKTEFRKHSHGIIKVEKNFEPPVIICQRCVLAALKIELEKK